MATSLIHSGKIMRRTESRKSHSWWWDSHVSPKNSRWLSENLEEMDKSVKRMLKLIDEEGDSFAKKAEMYYQKRPELVSHVEEFYRMYRSLAERYDHVTGELRKSIPSDLQSQCSTISDSGSDQLPWPSPSPSPSPDQRLGRRRSGTRAAGFEFFLGSGGGSGISDIYQKGDDESSTLTESEVESDDDSVNNYSVVSGNGSDQALHRKIVELEIELRDVKEKLRAQQDDGSDGSRGHGKYCSEQEIAITKEKLRSSEEEVERLITSLQKYESPEEFDESSEGVDRGLVEALRITKGKLRVSENEITSLRYELERNKEKTRHLQEQLELALKDVITSKTKLNAEKREISKLQERVSRLKGSLSDRDREAMDLKIAVSDAEQKIFPEKAKIKAEISKLIEERVLLVEQMRELENQGRCFEDEIRTIKAERSEMEERLNGEIERLNEEAVDRANLIESLNSSFDSMKTEKDGLELRVASLNEEVTCKASKISHLSEKLINLEKERTGLANEAKEACRRMEDLKSKIGEFEKEIERQRVAISDRAEEKREAIRQLCLSIEHYRNGFESLRMSFQSHKREPVSTSCLCFS